MIEPADRLIYVFSIQRFPALSLWSTMTVCRSEIFSEGRSWGPSLYGTSVIDSYVDMVSPLRGFRSNA